MPLASIVGTVLCVGTNIYSNILRGVVISSMSSCKNSSAKSYSQSGNLKHLPRLQPSWKKFVLFPTKFVQNFNKCIQVMLHFKHAPF